MASEGMARVKSRNRVKKNPKLPSVIPNSIGVGQ